MSFSEWLIRELLHICAFLWDIALIVVWVTGIILVISLVAANHMILGIALFLAIFYMFERSGQL